MPGKKTSFSAPKTKASPTKADSQTSLPNFVVENLQNLRQELRSWYAQMGRDLPWRQTRDPYRIWISEIMLQQTQVKTVLPYYYRWLQTFPTVEALAAANLQQVLKAWQGLGYYARARNLHRCAREIVQQHGGIFPQDKTVVLALPGIGRTTAGGILSAAFNQPVAILDGNVKRVLARIIGLSVPPAKATHQLWQLSETLLDPEHPRDFNQAMMDLGATVCTPHNPSCLLCPWQKHCHAFKFNLQSEIPMSETRSAIPHKLIGVAVIWNSRNEILIDQRKPDGLLGGLWEFPGGKIEPGETIEACIQREIREELGIEIEVGEHLITVDHAYSHFRVSLHVHHCRHVKGVPQPLECDQVRWVTLDELDQFPFPKANVKIIEALKNQLKKYRTYAD